MLSEPRSIDDMDVSEKISERLQRMPEHVQAEVLNYAEYLLARAEGEEAREGDRDWSRMSLISAMRGIDTEDDPEYTLDDLEQRFEP